MTKQMSRMLIGVGIFFGLIFGWWGLRQYLMAKGMENYVPPPVSVSSVAVKKELWHPELEATGTLKAINGVDISPEVSGIVQAIHFTSGQIVKKGDLLIEINANIEKSELQENTASLKLAKIDVDRKQLLYQNKAIAKSDYDTAESTYEQAQAKVSQSKAKIAQKNITAPFDGKVGIRNVDLGGFISNNNTIVTLQNLDYLLVDFSVPEQFTTLLETGQPVEVALDVPNATPYKGSIIAINSKLDEDTRALLAEAKIPNTQHKILPGISCHVTVFFPQKKESLIVPQTAINYTLYGDSVFLVKEGKDANGKTFSYAKEQPIKVGERRGNEVAILEGLQEGDLVIDAGQLKLANGTPVVIHNK